PVVEQRRLPVAGPPRKPSLALAFVALGEVAALGLRRGVAVEERRQLGAKHLFLGTPLELHGYRLGRLGDELRDARVARGEQLVTSALDVVDGPRLVGRYRPRRAPALQAADVAA